MSSPMFTEVLFLNLQGLVVRAVAVASGLELITVMNGNDGMSLTRGHRGVVRCHDAL